MLRTFLKIVGASILIILLAVGTAVQFLPRLAWSWVADKAHEFGVTLHRPTISWQWLGGLRFSLRLQELEADFVVDRAMDKPMDKAVNKTVDAVKGHLRLPSAQVTVDLTGYRDKNLVIVDELVLRDLEGQVQLELKSEKSEGRKSSEPFTVPRLDAFAMDLPAPPVQLQLSRLEFTTKNLQMAVKMTHVAASPPTLRSPDQTLQADASWESLQLRAKGSALSQSLASEAQLQIKNFNMEANTTTTNFAISKADLTIAAQGKSRPPTGAKIPTDWTGQADIKWQRWQAKVKSDQRNPVEWTGGTGSVGAQLLSPGPRLKVELHDLQGGPSGGGDETSRRLRHLRNATGVELRHPVTLVAEIRPVVEGSDLKLHLELQAPELAQARGEIKTARNLSRWQDELRGDLNFDLKGELLGLLSADWPANLTGRIRGTLRFQKEGSLVKNIAAQISAPWLSAQIAGQGDPEKKDADFSGFLVLRLPKAGVRLQGKKISGEVRWPLKVLLRGQERLFVETQLELREFSFEDPSLAVIGANGSVLISQSWAVRHGVWELSPSISWNPFNRIVVDSMADLDKDQKSLVIAKLKIGQREFGPLRLIASFRQNLLSVPSWTLQCQQGQLQGLLLADLHLDRPRAGFALRAVDLNLAKILPPDFLRGRKIQPDLTSFNLTVDLDVMNDLALGSFDWLQMTPGQVYNVLDLLDPLAEKPAFNQARTLLSSAYPTRVQTDLRGHVADFVIATNLINIPPIENVSIAPYLAKFHEDLYASKLMKKLLQVKESVHESVQRNATHYPTHHSTRHPHHNGRDRLRAEGLCG
ncbi:MAG: hypothetical protein C5B49_09480 [Bdellovibrio sp.]|nr:MAG: hypothetical protein C5B49_09480 [Bdellovibrio sp.]